MPSSAPCRGRRHSARRRSNAAAASCRAAATSIPAILSTGPGSICLGKQAGSACEPSVKASHGVGKEPMSTEQAPHIFISYASKDRARVIELASALEAAGVTIWRDQDQILG